MNIVVLAGGKSDEHDVSMSSGSKIANALIKKGHKILLLDLSSDIEKSNTFDEAYQLYKKDSYEAIINSTFEKCSGKEIGDNIIETCQSADITFLALHGGIGENGKLAALFDLYSIKYTGSGYQGSLLAMDKKISKELLRFHCIPTADWKIISKESDLSLVKFPGIVKPLDNGSSIGIYPVDNLLELEKAVKKSLLYSENSTILVEKRIIGREFSIGILDREVLPIIEISPKKGFYDYENKYQTGMAIEIVPANLPDDMRIKLQKMALQVHDLLSLEVYSRIDFIVSDNGEIFVIEANSLPGMTPNSLLPQEAEAFGLSYEDLCEKIVTLSLNKYD